MPGANSSEQRLRLFFALVPPREVQERLAALGQQLAVETRGRAVPCENLHATLAFLGDVDTRKVRALERLARMAPRLAIDLTLCEIGWFRRAQVAWIAPSSVPVSLRLLQDRVAEALRTAGFALDERPYRPHVTLVRKCKVAPLSREVDPIGWPKSRLALVSSVSVEGGVRYDELFGWSLG